MRYSILVVGSVTQLSAYDINLQVEPYVYITKEELIADGRKKVDRFRIGIISKILKGRIDYDEIFKKDNKGKIILDKTDDDLYEDFLEDYEKNFSKKIYSLDDKGNLLTSENPQGKWDYWTTHIGSLDTYFLVNGVRDFKSLKKNITNLGDCKFYAIVMEDTWYELNDYPKMEDWERVSKEIIDSLDPDTILYTVDANI